MCVYVYVFVYIYISVGCDFTLLSLLQFSLVKSFKYLLQDKNYYSIYMLYVYITILNILLLLYGLLCVYLCCCCCCHFNQYLLLMFLLSLRSSLGIKTRCYIDWFLFRFDFALISLCVCLVFLIVILYLCEALVKIKTYQIAHRMDDFLSDL